MFIIGNRDREKFDAQWMPEPNSGCWLWLGKLDRSGYGVFSGNVSAYRASYETVFGEVPLGLDLDHKCRVRICINPDHLDPVTRRENLLRGDTIPSKFIKRTTCNNGHCFSGSNLGYRTCKSSSGKRSIPYRYCKTCRNMWAKKNYAKRMRCSPSS